MEDTGERMTPEYDKGSIVWGEHIVRYLFTRQFVKDKVVLDIACGSGYGSEMMASSGAKMVYGVDISSESIKYAQKEFARENAEFLVGDGKKIPLRENLIDIVVTLETIEHIKEYEGFISEIKRVLKPNGLVILSTPNGRVYPKGNPFHVKEFNHDELEDLLRKNFKKQKFFYQENCFSSGIIPEELLKSSFSQVPAKTNIVNLMSKDPIDVLYFVVFASDSILPKVESVLATNPIPADIGELEKGYQKVVKVYEGKLRKTEKKLAIIENELKSIYGSKSWKLVKKLRELKHKIS